ncbi:MAG: hypothetical protein M3O70_25680 [Actinomycetota bacterium]|nr:hypothetical protein [Actinomycetota bacterium]
MELEDRWRMIRELLDMHGRGFAGELGIRVTNNPARLFGLVCLGTLSQPGIDPRKAAGAARALFDHGWTTSQEFAASSEEERAEVLAEANYPGDVPKVARALGDSAEMVVQRYDGDLREVRSKADGDPERLRELLSQMPGMSSAALDVFLRDVQAIWQEIAPFADPRALAAAKNLELADSADELLELVRAGGAEKLAWLVGALVLVDLEQEYDEVQRRMQAG